LKRLIACLFLAAPAFAQPYPSKPVRIIAPAAPGIMQDLLVRAVAEPLTRSLGQPVVVDNRVGADGIIGLEACARAAPDGHTLCNTMSGGFVWNPVLRAKLPYDPERDFTAVMQAGFFDSALVASTSAPVGSVPALLALAKSKPDTVNWASFGASTTGYMYMEWLRRSQGAAFYHVPYKSPPQALQALLTGEAQVGVQGLSSVASPLKSGKLRALAVTSSARQDWLPDVPTFDELGIKLPLRTWFGYHFPARTPGEIVQRMNGELRRAMALPEVRDAIVGRLMITPAAGTPEQFDEYIRVQRRQVAELVQFLGLKTE
jgi:tripartite-type tricarboxylate transporter receptor subunit TctC